MRRISGPVLCGFAVEFDRAWGRPCPRPPRITPTRIGGVLLGFRCPHCGAVRSEPVDPLRRAGWMDKIRGFQWCPTCQGRYVVRREGMPLGKPLPAGAAFGPARVEWGDGRTEVLEVPRPENAAEICDGGLASLGAVESVPAVASRSMSSIRIGRT